jgi:hypothetical protein
MGDTAKILLILVGILTACGGSVVAAWLRSIRRSERVRLYSEVPSPVLPAGPYNFDAEGWSDATLRDPNQVLAEIERIVYGERQAWLDRLELIKDLMRAYRVYQRSLVDGGSHLGCA